MINPLVPFTIRGVIWYQGEANASRAYQYRTLFPALITHWRNAWNEKFPFYFVQLPNLKRKHGSGWPELREAQLMTLSVENTGMVVTIDVGDSLDLHPRNKKPVGDRLAALAAARTYGIPGIADTGPVYEGAAREGNAIRVRMTPGKGRIRSVDDAVRGFTVAGPDRVFRVARARIEGHEVIVWSDDIAEPVAVRYAWGENPAWSITDDTGFPASPFRTDDWPEVTFHRR
jgi:sialate O-acetylesterase